MHSYPRAAVERMMKVQEVILRAMAKKITWWQAAEIIGMSDRQMRRLHWRYREHGYDGLLDRAEIEANQRSQLRLLAYGTTISPVFQRLAGYSGWRSTDERPIFAG